MPKAYADSEYYVNEYHGKLNIETLDFEKASRHIDTLTFNRVSMEDLTEFQREVVCTTCCMVAEFESENKDILESSYSSYSLNGASVKFDSSMAVTKINGIFIKNDIYRYLSQSGLCCRII